MDDKLKEFDHNDFNFRIVKLDAISNIDNKNKKRNEITYYFLVDDDNWIHDYKVQVKTLNITNITTPSHKSKNTPQKLFRKKLLRKLNLEHSYNEISNQRKEYFFFNEDEINKLGINEFLYQYDFTNITIRHFEYIIRGSNPTGEGKGSGFFKVKCSFDMEASSFGLFTKAIYVKKELKKIYREDSITYNTVWDDLWDSRDKITFDQWIQKNNELSWLWDDLKHNSQNWKNIINKFSKEMIPKKNKFIKLEREISRSRELLRRNIFSKFQTLDLFYLQVFIKRCNQISIQLAHIKPVWKIKKEYQIHNDLEKLRREISDIYNCLPLDANTHNFYDKNHSIYWSPDDGEINFLNNDYDKSLFKNFDRISDHWLKGSRKYLEEYKKMIFQNQ